MSAIRGDKQARNRVLSWVEARVKCNKAATRFRGKMGQLQERVCSLIVKVVQHRNYQVRLIQLLAEEMSSGAVLGSSLLDVGCGDIKPAILNLRQIAKDIGRTTSDVKNPRTRLWAYLLRHKGLSDGVSTEQGLEGRINARNRQDCPKSIRCLCHQLLRGFARLKTVQSISGCIAEGTMTSIR